MGQHEFRRLFQVLGQHVRTAGEGRFRPGRLNQVNIGPVTGHVGFQGIDGSQLHHGRGDGDRRQHAPCLLHLCLQFRRFSGPLEPEGQAVFFKGEDAADDFQAGRIVLRGFCLGEQAEPVQGRGRQGAAVGIHDGQDRKGSIPLFREAVPLQPVPAGFPNVQHRREKVVAQ